MKFKVWDYDNKVWLDNDSYVIFSDGELGYSEVNCLIGNYELVQYTGFKDKNGVEIYKGDIIKTTSINFRAPRYALVELVESCGCCFTCYGYNKDLEGGEVVGNKYENPELREKCE